MAELLTPLLVQESLSGMKLEVEDFIKSSCLVVVVSGAQRRISYQCDMFWLYLQGNLLLPRLRSGPLAAPICMNLILMFPGNATVRQSSPLHIPTLLSLQQVGLYSAARHLFGRYRLKIIQSVLTSSDGNSARFTAGREMFRTHVDAVGEVGFGAVELCGMR